MGVGGRWGAARPEMVGEMVGTINLIIEFLPIAQHPALGVPNLKREKRFVGVLEFYFEVNSRVICGLLLDYF